MISLLKKDKSGNELYSRQGEVFLFIAGLRQTRKLGTIKDDALFIKRQNKHIFRKFDAYGFNYELIKSLPLSMNIYVKQEDKTVLQTTVQNILNKGKILSFGSQGFELQTFLSRKDF